MLGTLTSSLKSKKTKAIPPSYYVNYTFGVILNLLCVAQAMTDFMPAYFTVLYLMISALVAFRYCFNYKSYNLIEFEEQYIFLQGKSPLQAEKLMQSKSLDAVGYYNKIAQFYAETFSGVYFEYKLQKRIQDSEQYLA